MTDTAMRLLLLFDIDGTLLSYGGAREHAAALIDALSEVFGVELPDDAVTRVRPYGKTDARIAREVLAAAGVDGDRFDRRSADWRARVWEIFEAMDLSRLRDGAAPGAAEALEWCAGNGHVNALLTGNMEAIAYRKLEAAGLGRWFTRGQGAFGSDAEDRRELVPVARERAGGWPAERTVVIGDAPGDVECALAGGAWVVALRGHFGDEELAGAHALIDGFAELSDALGRLQSR
jgi:phosphoglycolate phosphatase-like HAD superfamily hydrolase